MSARATRNVHLDTIGRDHLKWVEKIVAQIVYNPAVHLDLYFVGEHVELSS